PAPSPCCSSSSSPPACGASPTAATLRLSRPREAAGGDPGSPPPRIDCARVRGPPGVPPGSREFPRHRRGAVRPPEADLGQEPDHRREPRQDPYAQEVPRARLGGGG